MLDPATPTSHPQSGDRAPTGQTSPLSVGIWRRFVARLRKPFAQHPWAFEVALFAVGILVYQLSRALVIGDAPAAFENAIAVLNFERSTGLSVETSIQEFALTHLSVTKALNLFYVYGHYTITPIFFVWLYRKRRKWYPFVRNAFFTANGIALTMFMVFPVAPPRYLSSQGFIDTLRSISDIDLHTGTLAGWFNPYAAVPSMHFGYALMIGLVAFFLFRSWPLRIVGLIYPAIVFFAITGTANHYVLDAFAGSVVIATAFLLVRGWGWARPRIAARQTRQSTCAP
jgi:PAP2 superfamily